MKGKAGNGHAENFKGENNILLLGGGGGLVSKFCLTLASPWTVAHQALPSMGFPRQEYCSGLPFPSPGDLPSRGIKPGSPVSPALASRFFTTEPPGKPILLHKTG